MFTFKKKFIPINKSLIADTCVQLWYVRWNSRHGSFSYDTKPEVEAFTDEQEAKDFKLALENAFKLVKNTADNAVTLEKAK